MRRKLFMMAATALALFSGPRLGAQGVLPEGVPRDIIRTIELTSTALGESRTIDVALPASYGQGNRRYPVLVVLDGESLHLPATALVRFYASVGELPEMIVVGVRNTNRLRDLTPAPRPGWRPPPGASGGASGFADVLERDVLRAVEATYRTEPFRVLVGHSLGGLFGLHLIGRRPGLVQGYILLDPATWWNAEADFEAARSALTTPAHRHSRVMLANTRQTALDTTSMGGTRPMLRHFSTPGDTHANMPIQGMMRGLRMMFADFRVPSWKPWQRPIEMLAESDSLSARLGYPVSIPENLYVSAAQMSIASRHFDDVDWIVQRMRAAGAAGQAVERIERELATAREGPAPANFVPLVYPSRRPQAVDARRSGLLGMWRGVVDLPGASVDPAQELVFVVSGDTVAMTLKQQLGAMITEGGVSVLKLESDGAVEWVEPLRGIAGAMVYRGRIAPDGALVGDVEVRGFVPPPTWVPPTFRFERVSP